jgi:chorismate lyase / 3-hydroxybenzoate synthase
MAVPTEAPRGAFPWRVTFSGAGQNSGSGAHTLPVGVPCLAGVPQEQIFPAAVAAGIAGEFQLFEAGDLLLGYSSVAVTGATVEKITRSLYHDLLAACEGRQLYRIWNYVPQINEETGGLEHYRAFCRGRSEAFERAFGSDYKKYLPAASAVGCDDGHLAILFAAGKAEPRHVENPEQVPAYEYPREHGPRAPSFSRATIAATGEHSYVFISGTAAIKGHATVAPGALDEQIACTLHNLRLISRTSGAGDDLGRATGWTRHFKIYLRRSDDLQHASELLADGLLAPADRVTWLRADICRAALNIEIEASLVRPNRR